MPGTFDHDQVISESEHSFHGPNQPDLVVKMSEARINNAAAGSLEPASHLINQDLHYESTGERLGVGYLPRLATINVFCHWQ